MLIDASALIHRFFHALPPFTTPKGEPSGALYGLSGTLLKILKEQTPDYIVAAFDRPEKTFREEEFKEYKIHRPPTDPGLVSQIVRMYEVFRLFGVRIVEKAGFEADDLIGSLVEKFKKEKDLRIIVMSGDLDILQLVEGEKVVGQMFKTGITETVIYDEKAVEERFGVSPAQLPDYKGFVGDTSDNIPGVKGVGPKTAAPLIKEFGSLEEIFENLMIIPEKVAKKFSGQKEIALLSKKLATIRRDAPLDVKSIEELKAKPLDKEKLRSYFQNMGFKSLLERLEK